MRYKVTTRGSRTRLILLVTTLLDPVAYPSSALAQLYNKRWQIETNFRHLKQTMNMDALHCHSVEGVQKELAMYTLVYNLIRLVMLEASANQTVPVERISFIGAVRYLAEATHRNTYLHLRVNPHRPNRIEPRCVKRRPKQYTLFQRPRSELRKHLKTLRLNALLHAILDCPLLAFLPLNSMAKNSAVNKILVKGPAKDRVIKHRRPHFHQNRRQSKANADLDRGVGLSQFHVLGDGPGISENHFQ